MTDTAPTSPIALIAEDEPLLADNLRAELATVWPALRVVAQAGSGTAALALALQHRPQVCFLDIRMPGMTGLDAAQATTLLWETYDPHLKVWLPFAGIGVAAIIALVFFARAARRWADMDA